MNTPAVEYAEDVKITFRLVEFHARRHARGADAARVMVITNGIDDELLWMSAEDIRMNIATFGPSEELRAALDHYEK